MQLTHLARCAGPVIPVTSNTPNRHTRTTIRVADECRDQARPIATRITLNTVSAKTSHICASQLYQSGMTLFAIQELLGHSWTGTTARYVKPRVLHQPGEKPQVTRSSRYRNSVSDPQAAVA